MSVLRFNSLSRITSWRSDSSFAVRTEFSLRKPSSHSFFDLVYILHVKRGNKERKTGVKHALYHTFMRLKGITRYDNKEKARQYLNARSFTHLEDGLSPGAGMNSSEENTSSCRKIICDVHFVCNVATPQYNRAAQTIISQRPFKQPTDSVLWATSRHLKWQCKKPENNKWFPENGYSIKKWMVSWWTMIYDQGRAERIWHHNIRYMDDKDLTCDSIHLAVAAIYKMLCRNGQSPLHL